MALVVGTHFLTYDILKKCEGNLFWEWVEHGTLDAYFNRNKKKMY